jgi:hypothetical protein
MPLERSREVLSFTVTRLWLPLNERARPNFAGVMRVAFGRVPWFPLPDASRTWVPLLSSNP